jgi:hypothetical protein
MLAASSQQFSIIPDSTYLSDFFHDIVTCMVVHATNMTGCNSDDWIN